MHCCFLGFHAWGKWLTVKDGDTVVNQMIVGRFIYQEKECQSCGKKKLRREGTSDNH